MLRNVKVLLYGKLLRNATVLAYKSKMLWFAKVPVYKQNANIC